MVEFYVLPWNHSWDDIYTSDMHMNETVICPRNFGVIFRTVGADFAQNFIVHTLHSVHATLRVHTMQHSLVGPG